MSLVILPPLVDEKAFERLMCDLMNHIHHTTSFSLYGLRGQRQDGIDIFSSQHRTVVQCTCKDPSQSDRGYVEGMIKKLLHDFDQTVRLKIPFDFFIFATTYKNDKRIQDYCALISLNTARHVEYWSWEKITDYLLSETFLLKKYYPHFFSSGLSFGRITMASSCSYLPMGKEYCYELKSNPEKSDYPILDFSFLNNSDDVVLLNAISVKGRFMNMARAGTYEKPVGLLNVHAQFDIEPNIPLRFTVEWGNATLQLEAPMYIAPKHPARVQIRLLQVIIGFCKLYFEFKFNDIILTTPVFFFNSDHDGAPDIPNDLIRDLQNQK